MAETKATRKELFERIIEVMADDPEVVEMAEKYIAQLTKPRKKTENKEAAAFRAAVATWLSEHEGAYTNAEMAEAMGVSAQKMSAALRRLVADDVVIRVEPEDKKGKPAFTLA